MSAEPDEAREFAKAYRQFLAWVHEEDEARGGTAEVVALVRNHLPGEALTRSVVTRELATFEQVNLQVAVDAWIVEDQRRVEVHGLTVAPHYGPVSLQQIVHGDGLPPLRLSAPDLVDLPSGPGRTVACLLRAFLLVQDRRGSYVVLLRAPDRSYDQPLSLEIAGLATEDAQEVLGELDELRSRLNIYRGQLLELVASEMGVSIVFPVLPPTERADVVLPEAVLGRIERHTLDISLHREALLAAGQHLKRGLLLYGPPGAGKTHTTRYIVQQMVGTTVLLMSGQSLHYIGMVSTLARELQPAAVVLEDVDLVAEDRGFGPGPSPVLFTLLDAMDGAAADADLLFLLTTNRADLLEPALAARPGRVDVAIEIELPDADARRRLFAVYSRTLPLSLNEAEIDEVVERTAGVTASFVKELLRRAALEALTEGDGSLGQVTGAHVSRALDALLESGQSVTRALLGVQDGNEAPPPVSGRSSAGHGGVGWMKAPRAYLGRLPPR
jgi:cell division protease FtsH